MSKILNEPTVPPFLRWTGSKRWFVKDHIQNFQPSDYNNYHEPFLGGGAIFFYMKGLNQKDNRSYFLSDINGDLINCYTKLRESPELVVSHLEQYRNTEEDYYRIRATDSVDSFQKAAKFIFLNRTSFNGIYRVNSEGLYNVPYGKRTKVDWITKDLLISVGKVLSNVSLDHMSFEETLHRIEEDDLVFIDPPYTVAHENNGFIEYNQKLFSWEDQIKLRKFVDGIIDKGAYFILTNASHHSIQELYDNVGNATKLCRSSKVGGRIKTRGNFNEIVIYNTK